MFTVLLKEMEEFIKIFRRTAPVCCKYFSEQRRGRRGAGEYGASDKFFLPRARGRCMLKTKEKLNGTCGKDEVTWNHYGGGVSLKVLLCMLSL